MLQIFSLFILAFVVGKGFSDRAMAQSLVVSGSLLVDLKIVPSLGTLCSFCETDAYFIQVIGIKPSLMVQPVDGPTLMSAFSILEIQTHSIEPLHHISFFLRAVVVLLRPSSRVNAVEVLKISALSH